jgi:hypothetical protein
MDHNYLKIGKLSEVIELYVLQEKIKENKELFKKYLRVETNL